MEKKKIYRILLYISAAVLIAVAGFFGMEKLSDYARSSITERLREHFNGDLYIEKIDYTLTRIVLHNLRVDDVTTPAAYPFFYMKSISVFIPYHWLFYGERRFGRIEINGLSMNIEKYNGVWNTERNIRAGVAGWKEPLKLPVQELVIEKSFCSISMPIAGKRRLYPLEDITASLMRDNEEFEISLSGEIKGERFNLESLVDYIDNKNDDSSGIYSVALKRLDYNSEGGNVSLEGLRGHLKILSDRINIAGLGGLLAVKDMSVPFSRLRAGIALNDNNFALRNFNVKVFRGSMKGSGEFHPGRFYSGEFTLNDIDISKMVKFYRGTDRKIDGKLHLDMKIEALRQNRWTPRGRGHLQADHVLIPKLKAVDRVSVNWKYRKRKFLLDDIKISTGEKKLYGRGHITRKGGLDIYFTTEANRSLLGYVPVIGYISHELSNAAFRINGTLRDPEFDLTLARSIPGILVGSVFDVIRLAFTPITRAVEFIADEED